MNRFFADGDVVLFQGDSVTDCGRDREVKFAAPGVSDENAHKALGNGYPTFIKTAYDVFFPGNNVTFVNRAVSGDRTDHLLERYKEDFVEVNPDFVSILIGVNDSWRNFDRDSSFYTSAEEFGERYETLLKQIKADLPSAKIMLIEQWSFPQMVEKNILDTSKFTISEWEKDVADKLEYTKELGKRYGDYYLPMYSIMTEQTAQQENVSRDGVHPIAAGHEIIANTYLKMLGII